MKLFAVARDLVARGMSPFSDRASCYIHFTWGCLEHASELSPLLEDLESVLALSILGLITGNWFLALLNHVYWLLRYRMITFMSKWMLPM